MAAATVIKLPATLPRGGGAQGTGETRLNPLAPAPWQQWQAGGLWASSYRQGS